MQEQRDDPQEKCEPLCLGSVSYPKRPPYESRFCFSLIKGLFSYYAASLLLAHCASRGMTLFLRSYFCQFTNGAYLITFLYIHEECIHVCDS